MDKKATVFFENIDNTKSSCWQWVGKTNDSGDGVFAFEGVQLLAKDFMRSLVTGLPFACSRTKSICKNQLCMNPTHHKFYGELSGINVEKYRAMTDKEFENFLNGRKSKSEVLPFD